MDTDTDWNTDWPREELIRNLRARVLDHKFLYGSDGQSHYYQKDSYRPEQPESLNPDDAVALLANTFEHATRLAVVALGCGNARRESETLQALNLAEQNLTLIAVDASPSMAQEARQTLSQARFQTRVLSADFTHPQFQQQIIDATSGFEQVIYCLIGSTFGNFQPEVLISALKRLVKAGQYFWFDCVTLAEDSPAAAQDLVARYTQRLTDEDKLRFMFYPLARLGLPREAGQIRLEETELLLDEYSGGRVFRYLFRFHADFQLEALGERFPFEAQDDIQLLEIRAFKPDKLIQYFTSHGFELKNQVYKSIRGQFLFQKSDSI